MVRLVLQSERRVVHVMGQMWQVIGMREKEKAQPASVLPTSLESAAGAEIPWEHRTPTVKPGKTGEMRALRERAESV